MGDAFAGLEVVEDPGDPLHGLEVVPQGGAAPALGRAPTRRRMLPIESFVLGGRDAASLGFDDEAGGLGAWLNAKLNGETDRALRRGIESPLSSRTSYQAERDYQRDLKHTAEEDNPLSYLGGELVGSAATAAVGPEAAPALTLGARAKQAAKVGAGFGAVTGLGASEAEDLGGMALDTGVGAITGGVLAPAAGEVVHQVATRGQPIVAAAKRWLGDQADAFLQRINAAYGPDVAQRARLLADASSPEGARLRALAREGADPDALESQARRMTRGVDELQQLAPEPATEAELALARRGADQDLLEADARELADRVSQIARNLDEIQADETIAKKTRIATKYFKQDGLEPERLIEAADTVARNVRQTVQEMLAPTNTVPGTEDHRLLKHIEKEMLEYDLPGHGEFFDEYERAGDKWARLDQIKRSLQKRLKNVRFNSPEVETLHGLEEAIRNNLENTGVWGEGAAGMQMRRNRAWHELLTLEDTRDVSPRKEFLTDYRGLPSASEKSYRVLAEGDPAGIAGALKNAAELGGDQAVWKLGEVMKRRAKLAEALADHIDASPELLAKARHSRALADEIEAALQARAGEAEAARKVGKVSQGIREANAREGSPRQVLFRDAGTGPADPFFEKLAADPSKVRQLLQEAGTFDNQGRERAVREWAESQARELEAQAAVNPQLADRARRARAVADEVAHALELRSATGTAARELQGITAADPEAQGLGRRLAAGAASPFAAPALGAAAGVALSDAEDPAGRLQAAAEGAAAGAGLRMLARRSPTGRTIGQLVEDLVSGTPALGARAREIAQLERALQLDPGNKAAAQRLQDLARLSPTLQRLLARRAEQPVNVGKVGAALERYARAGTGYSSGQAAASLTSAHRNDVPPGPLEVGASDPQYAQDFAGQDQDAAALTHADLMATDPEFRERVAQRAEELGETEAQEALEDEDLEGNP